MSDRIKWQVTAVTVCVISVASVGQSALGSEQAHPQLLPGDRVLIGTVQEVRGAQARIDTGEVEPRFVPMGVREAKALPDLKKGDRVGITVNDKNLLADVHLVGEASYHRIVEGRLIEPLVTGHDHAVLRTTQGKEESHTIRPVARSKVASVPVGVDAVFLLDESDRVVEVTFGSKEAARRAAELWEKKTPLKGNFDKVSGMGRKWTRDAVFIMFFQRDSGLCPRLRAPHWAIRRRVDTVHRTGTRTRELLHG